MFHKRDARIGKANIPQAETHKQDLIWAGSLRYANGIGPTGSLRFYSELRERVHLRV